MRYVFEGHCSLVVKGKYLITNGTSRSRKRTDDYNFVDACGNRFSNSRNPFGAEIDS